ncbi:beta-N-acetylhexosaminidase [Veronia pacifica]|uniref:Beta-hexosaminidase n=1 Tax=Veronia pacifica TaxID=1080227 RepID=A0A1C3EPC7_9GAMM|nr:beta-N-acetylhexosaminidase [Veronia pacifica]ODA35081.1 beta-N-acetylhexosaminidase [Veronia pacifica]
MGPLWIDLEGCELDAEERELLEHPIVGGVILFARNYHDNQQLLALTKSIRKASKKDILIGVDQEGGRVQRFRDGFTRLPPAQKYQGQPNGLTLAEDSAWLLAAELIAHDIDLSFAPVMDCGHGSRAIGDRAFSDDIEKVTDYTEAFIRGMSQAGMATTGKHFPGHGGVLEDSHLESPIDDRNNIFERDMRVFERHIKKGLLDAMMPAHIIYSNYDADPASGSSYWLKDILRQKLGFKGVIFSDDLSMEGATVMGGPAERAKKALDAGCDLLLMCNNRESTIAAVDSLPISDVPAAACLKKRTTFTMSELRLSDRWKKTRSQLERLIEG